jgi:histidyl-tRNA synthetase
VDGGAVVDTTGGDQALSLTDELRRAGLRADRAWDARSMKAQMRAADRSGAALQVLGTPVQDVFFN